MIAPAEYRQQVYVAFAAKFMALFTKNTTNWAREVLEFALEIALLAAAHS